MTKAVVRVFVGLGIVALAGGPAWAYLDPGSGSMMLQALLGGAAGVAVLLKIYWRRLRGLVGIGRRAEQTAGAPADAEAGADADADKRRG
jgi:hypothetical protein